MAPAQTGIFTSFIFHVGNPAELTGLSEKSAFISPDNAGDRQRPNRRLSGRRYLMETRHTFMLFYETSDTGGEPRIGVGGAGQVRRRTVAILLALMIVLPIISILRQPPRAVPPRRRATTPRRAADLSTFTRTVLHGNDNGKEQP